jgi:hypothetical protein
MRNPAFLLLLFLLCPVCNAQAQQPGGTIQILINGLTAKLASPALGEETIVSLVAVQPDKYSLGSEPSQTSN